jgi:hypothetical protein
MRVLANVKKVSAEIYANPSIYASKENTHVLPEILQPAIASRPMLHAIISAGAGARTRLSFQTSSTRRTIPPLLSIGALSIVLKR